MATRSRMTELAKLSTAALLGAALVGGVSAYGATGTSGQAEPPNLGKVKLAVQDYYGDYLDPQGHHHASPASPWATQTEQQVREAKGYLKQRLVDGVRNPAIVLDIDDTSELTYGWEADRDFAYTDAEFDDAVQKDDFTAINATRDLATWANQHGVKVFFLTGRGEHLADPSLRNLAREGYPKPAGAFFEPEKTPPPYLPCGLNCTTVQYKSGTRAHIESQGNTVVLTVGDQYSDLKGGHAEKPVKLPNPMYYLP